MHQWPMHDIYMYHKYIDLRITSPQSSPSSNKWRKKKNCLGFPQPGTGSTAHFLEALSLCWIAVRQDALTNGCQLFQEKDITGTVLSRSTKLLEQGVLGDRNVGGAQHRAKSTHDHDQAKRGHNSDTVAPEAHRCGQSALGKPIFHWQLLGCEVRDSAPCQEVVAQGQFLSLMLDQVSAESWRAGFERLFKNSAHLFALQASRRVWANISALYVIKQFLAWWSTSA